MSDPLDYLLRRRQVESALGDIARRAAQEAHARAARISRALIDETKDVDAYTVQLFQEVAGEVASLRLSRRESLAHVRVVLNSLRPRQEGVYLSMQPKIELEARSVARDHGAYMAAAIDLATKRNLGPSLSDESPWGFLGSASNALASIGRGKVRRAFAAFRRGERKPTGFVRWGAAALQSVVETAFSEALNATLAEIYRGRADVLSGYEWLADDAETQVCVDRKGKTYSLTSTVRPPAHFRCRSVIAPRIHSRVRVLDAVSLGVAA